MRVTPLDLLNFQSSEQDVIRCLIRRPQLTATEIAFFTRIPLAELNELLIKMVQSTKLLKETSGDNPMFSVAYAKKENTKKAGTTTLLDSLFG